jgi:hypothetical protein
VNDLALEQLGRKTLASLARTQVALALMLLAPA